MSELRREISSYTSVYLPGLTVQKEHELLSILFDSRAGFEKRLYLSHFLKVCGWGIEQILDVIEKYNRWEGYNRKKTENIIKRLVFNQRSEGSEKLTHTPFVNASERSVFDLIDSFFQNCKPVCLSPPVYLPHASFFFHSMGFSTIPCLEGTKRPAIMKWKPFQDRQPDISLLKKWNWNGGLILLGSHQYCFLDIDMKNEKHPNGFEHFDESRLKGWCYEKTPGGGYHVFGRGNMKTDKKFRGTAEIIGYGAYIKAFPSAGYIFHGNDQK